MKANKSFLWALLAVVVVLSGCAGNLVQRADGTFFEAVTAQAGPDRSGTSYSDYKADGVTPDGKLINPVLLKPRDLAVGPTVAGQVIVGVTSGVATAGTQGLFGLAIARENNKRCEGGNCGTIINNLNRADAGALSNSKSGADVGVNITGGGSCKGACLAQ